MNCESGGIDVEGLVYQIDVFFDIFQHVKIYKFKEVLKIGNSYGEDQKTKVIKMYKK